jgi:hypothetical protein
MKIHATRPLRQAFNIRETALGACRYVPVVHGARCQRAHGGPLKSISRMRHRPIAVANRRPIR